MTPHLPAICAVAIASIVSFGSAEDRMAVNGPNPDGATFHERLSANGKAANGSGDGASRIEILAVTLPPRTASGGSSGGSGQCPVWGCMSNGTQLNGYAPVR